MMMSHSNVTRVCSLALPFPIQYLGRRTVVSDHSLSSMIQCIALVCDVCIVSAVIDTKVMSRSSNVFAELKKMLFIYIF